MTGLDLANYDIKVLYQSKNSARKSANTVRQIEQKLQDSVLMKQWSKSINIDDVEDDDVDGIVRNTGFFSTLSISSQSSSQSSELLKWSCKP